MLKRVRLLLIVVEREVFSIEEKEREDGGGLKCGRCEAI
jgi:hypothetical protein